MFKIAFALGSLLVIASCSQPQPSQHVETKATLANEELIQKGKYITTVSGCNDCHSPKIMTEHGPEPDTTRLLSGHPMNEPLAPLVNSAGWVQFSMGLTATVGPWGISYAANLTPHETGIGNWTFQQFETAIRKGKSKGLENNRMLLPPMPWQMYRHMTDEDLRAVFAYLKSIQPVNNLVPAAKSPDQLSKLASAR